MSLSIDCGTMHLVKGELDPVDDTPTFEVERNVFAEVRSNLENPEEVLKENNYSYVKYKDQFYVIGEDVYKVHEIESLFKKQGTSYFSNIRRPMKDGFLNTAQDKMAIPIIQEMIRRLLGKPKYPGEVVCFCAPGNPVNSNNNVTFHQAILENFIASLGFQPECINEALALIYSECPTEEDPEEPEGIAKFSGIGMSFGAGLVNVCFARKQLPLLNFSIENSGDYIDKEAANIAGCDIATITKYKERYLDLNNVDQSDVKQLGLNCYYNAMIKNAVTNFASRFERLDEKDKKQTPIEIVIGGGTASVPGFVEKFTEVLNTLDLPFKVKGVRLAKNPLFAVSNGCLIKALKVESKKQENQRQKSKNKE